MDKVAMLTKSTQQDKSRAIYFKTIQPTDIDKPPSNRHIGALKLIYYYTKEHSVANSPQSIKRARQMVKRRIHNMAQRSEMRTYIKNTLNAIASGDIEKAKANFASMTKNLDTLARRGTIHPNKAARLKSRMNKKLKTAVNA